MQPKCPICGEPTDGATLDFGRAFHFECEGKHDFVVRAEMVAIVSESSRDMRKNIGIQCEKRTDDLIAQISNNAGRPLVELVPRSNWLK